MQLVRLFSLTPVHERRWNDFIDEEISGTPYQTTYFHDWWRGVDPSLADMGYFIGYKRSEICFVGYGFIRTRDGQLIGEFPHGPAARTIDDMIGGLRALKESIGTNATFQVGPYFKADERTLAVTSQMGFSATSRRWHDATVVIDLTEANDALLASFHPMARRAIRKAASLGYTVTIEQDDKAIENFVAIQHALATSRNFGAIPRRYLENVVNDRRHSKRAAMFFLRDGAGEILAVALVIRTKRLAWYQYGASSKGRPVRAQFLHWKIMEWAREMGSEQYDLGGVNVHDPHCSVTRFKLTLAKDRCPVRLFPQLCYSPTSGCQE